MFQRSAIVRGLVTGALLACAAVFNATCKLDELVSPPPSGSLATSLSQVLDSARVGSTAQRTATVGISNAGQGSLTWQVARAQGSAWLALSATGGSAPGSLTLTLNPTGLDLGTHRDTLVFSSSGGGSDPTRVPVRFDIQPCAVRAVSVGASFNDSLSTADCVAPRRPQSFARLYRTESNGGDSVTVWLLSSDFDGFLTIDTVPDGTAPIAEAGDCSASPGDACLVYVQLPDSGAYFISATSAQASDTGAFTLTLSSPRNPATPDQLLQFSGDSSSGVGVGSLLGDSAAVFRARMNDPDLGDSVRLEVELQLIGSAFAGTPTGVSSFVARGDSAFVALTGLADDQGYAWRARARDITNRSSSWVSFGANGDSDPDFTVNVPEAPVAPTALQQLRSNGTTVLAVGDTTPERTVMFAAVVSDPDPTDLLRLEVEVRPVGTPFTGTAQGSSVQTANGGTAMVPVPGLSDETGYHWRARAVDQSGNAGPWILFGNNPEFEADLFVSAPDSPNAPGSLEQLRSDSTVAIAVGGTATRDTVVFRALVTDPDPTDSLRLQVETRPLGVSFTGIPTDSSALVQVGSQAFVRVAGLPDDTDYHWRARAVDALGSASSWVSFGGNAESVPDFRVRVPAVQLAFTTQPSAAPVNTAIDPPVVVQALEASGVVDTSFAANITVSLTPNTGTAGALLSGTKTLPPMAGVATFADLGIDLVGSGYTLTASASGLVSAISAPFDILPGSAARLALAVPPSSTAQSGLPLQQQPEVQIQDANGNDVAQQGVLVTATVATGPAGAVLSGATATTDASGLATFSGLTLSGLVGSYTLRFSATGFVSVVSDIVVLGPGTADAGQSTALVLDGTAGSVSSVAVTTRDASGNNLTVGGGTVAVSVSGANTATAAVTDKGDGTYTATYTPIKSGTDNVAITLNGTAIGGSPYTSTIAPAAATKIAANAGDNQTAVAGTAVAINPSVIVTDLYDNGVSGIGVTFTVTGGLGTVNPTTPVTTDASGIAAVTSWTLGTSAGTNTMEASTNPLLNGSPVVFTATGTAGSAGQLSVTTQPSPSAQSGIVLATQPAIQLEDPFGNPVPTEFVLVTAAIVSGPGGSQLVPDPATALTDASGVATFTNLAISGPTGTYTLGFTTTGNVSGISSDPIILDPGTAAKLTITTQPSSTASSGVPLAQQPVVQIQDGAGNDVSQPGTQVFANLSGGGSLSGTNPVTTNSSGTATFTDLTITGTVGQQTLFFSAFGLTATPTSNTIDLGPGAADPAQTTASVGPGVAGSVTTIDVQARDANGNALTTGGATVAVTVEPGSANAGATVTVVDDGDGTYTATYTPGAAGQDTFEIRLNGTVIGGGPYISNVT